MINRLKGWDYQLWFALWRGWRWAFNVFFGILITIVIFYITVYTIATNLIDRVAFYLATAAQFSGLPFDWRLAALGGGLFLIAALFVAAYQLYKYFVIRPRTITMEDLDIQLTAVMEGITDLKNRRDD